MVLGAVSDVEMQEHYDEFFEVSDLGTRYLWCFTSSLPNLPVAHRINLLSPIYFSQQDQYCCANIVPVH